MTVDTKSATVVVLQQFKMLSVAFNNTFLAKFTYFCGQSAAVNLKIIGKFLSVKGNIKTTAFRFL